MPANNIVATQISGYNFQTTIDGHLIHTDMSIDKGGSGIGPGPKILMLVSLAGCTGIDVVMILDKMRVNYRSLTIAIDAELTDTEPKIYHKVLITYSVTLDEKARLNMEKAVKLSLDKYCGVSAMFKAFATVDSDIKFL